MSVLDIGSSALQAAYTRLQTTSHNIANASTPGYSRQEALSESLGAQFTGGGFIGGGVAITTIARSYDHHLTREMHTAQANLSNDRARADSLARIDRLFSDSEHGIGARYDSMSLAMADLVNQPHDVAVRTVALHRADDLASTVRGIDNELDRIRSDTDRQAGQLVSQVNTDLEELARLNTRIAAAAGERQPPNDLMDQRDAIIDRVNTVLQATAHINENNSVSLFASTGDALILGDDSARLALSSEEGNPERMQLLLVTNGDTVPLNQTMLGGGELAGLLEFRNDDISIARGRLGQIAGALTYSYNQQQSLGIDANGNQGQALFQTAAPQVVPSMLNTGNAQMSVAIVDGTALKPSDYKLDFISGQYRLTRLTDGVVTNPPGFPHDVDGVSINLDSGTMAEGDSILLKTSTAMSGEFEVVMADQSQWAAAFPALAVAGAANAGTVAIADFAVTSVNANVTEPVTLTFDGAGTVAVRGTGTGNPDIPWVAGDNLSFNGWELTMLGTPQAGDTVTITPPLEPRADNRNAHALLGLSDSNIIDGAPPSQTFSAMIGEIGSRSQSAANHALQSEAWHTSAVAARDAVSGVNLDEEAARLIQYQQAYQAAARVISSAQSMFDSLLTIGR
ncbi:MAG: flagellar hook-associated protein FlgK [Burkholderiaceae bacterium]